jgi:MoaA/NifB/PqqE/SkfB family radical SAM enzyme
VRVIIKVGRSCNNNCTFCHASDRRRGDETRAIIEAKIRRAHEHDASMVILSGGEPTLHPDLDAFADAVRAHGMDLGIITNGRRLADPKRAEALLQHGLRYAYVSLHGSTASIHDSVVRARAFDDTLQGIRNLAGRVDELTINTVVTKHNLGDLRDIVDLLEPIAPACIKFTFPQPKGAVLDAFDDVVPPLKDAAKAVADAVAHGAGSNRPDPARFGLEGFPSCVIPRLTHLRNDLRTHDIAYLSEPDDVDLVEVDTVLSTKTARCETCKLRDGCPGIYRVYAEKFGDGELTAFVDGSPQDVTITPDDIAEREQAAHERRHWVRLTYACNNRCRFCLDRDTGRSDARRDEAIKRDIVQGRRLGAERLILSGGEATTHPRFPSFVRLGRRAGYRWVQTVSNGRMLSYPKFLASVIAAGLDEVTVSMHGHTAELHDGLVGVAGAFDQASRGIQSALSSRRLVVNIDIVINAHNVDHLPEMLETFVGWGVREFDLLHLIPFGSAWLPEQQDLFYDLAAHAEPIHRALAYSQHEGVHLWLNRFPPEHAEGFEFLIQDPHKLDDEVRGRLEAFETFTHGGPHLPCRSPSRCARCYLQGLCDAFERSRASTRAERIDQLRVVASSQPLPPLPIAAVAEIVAPDVEQAAAMVGKLRAEGLRLRLEDATGLAARIGPLATLEGLPVREVVVSRPEHLAPALACPSKIDVVIELNQHTAASIPSLASHANQLVLEQPTHERLTEASADDVDLRALFEGLAFPVRTRGIAPCLSGQLPEGPRGVLDVASLREDGTIDPRAFTSLYARDLFFARSLRCRDCLSASSCRGMHLNWVRAHGFAKLDPTRCPRND